MPYVKSLGEVTITTLIGHTIHVPANTPTYVPPSVMPFTRQFGCVECNEAGDLILEQTNKPPRIPIAEVPQLTPEERDDPKHRQRVLVLAIAKLYTDNRDDDFTVATHAPKVRSVERVVGFPVTGQELQAAFELYQLEN